MIRALAQATAVLMTVALIAFSMFRYVGDPVANMAGPETTKEELSQLRERLGLNDPLPVQFGRFVANAAQGDFGISYRQGRRVSTLIAERLPATLELALLSALFATVAGALLAIWLRYTGPDTTLSFEIMLDILLIVVIGGMGTLYGAALGSVIFVFAQNYLQDLLKLAGSALEHVPVAGALVSPDRWLLWLGVLFVLAVYHFPSGIVGRLRSAVGAGNRS